MFIHIPKCAGTSVRTSLSAYDSFEGYFSGLKPLPGTNQIVDYTHLPLSVVANKFGDTFAHIADFDSFAIVRDPYDRFLSAVSQSLKVSPPVAQSMFDPKLVQSRCLEICAKLSEEVDFLASPDLIHFAPQSIFVDYRGDRIVKHLFALEEIAALFFSLKKYVALDFVPPPIMNSSEVPHSLLADKAWYFGKKIFAARMFDNFRPYLRDYSRSLFFRQTGWSSSFVLPAEVREFVKTFYLHDFRLREELMNTSHSAFSVNFDDS